MNALHLDDLVESSHRSSYPLFDTKSERLTNSLEKSKKKKKKKSISIIENNSNVSAITFESVGNTPCRSAEKKKTGKQATTNDNNKNTQQGGIRKNCHMQDNKPIDSSLEKSMMNSGVSGRFINEKNILLSSNNLTNIEFTHSKSTYCQQRLSPNSFHGLISVNDIEDKFKTGIETLESNSVITNSYKSEAQSSHGINIRFFSLFFFIFF